MPYHFQYVPPSGPLSGQSLEEQTARAINELGGHFDQVSEETSALANQALNMAHTAGGTANEALSTANQSLSLAQDAQDAAQNAQTASEQARDAALNAQDLSYQCLDASATAGDMAQSALDASAGAANAADTALAASRVAENKSAEAETMARSALNYQAGDFNLDETTVDADTLIASARIYAAQELLGAPVTAPAYLEIMAGSDSASVTQAVWAESAPTPALRTGRIAWSAVPGESVFELAAVPENESGNGPDGPDDPDNPDYPDNPDSAENPGSRSLIGRLAIAHDGAALSAAFTPGQFILEEASDFALAGQLNFELGEDFTGSLHYNGQELVRISEGLAVIIDSQIFAENSGLTLHAAAYDGDTLTLGLRAAWLGKSSSVTWGNWTSAAGDAAGIPLGAWLWSPLKTVPFGFLDISKDNGLLSRAAFPQLWETVRADDSVVSESAWQESVAQFGGCGSFSSGDGATTFRLPLIAGLYARAYDPATPDLALGKCLGDAIRNITGATNLTVPSNAAGSGYQVTLSSGNFGAFYPLHDGNYAGGKYFSLVGEVTSARSIVLGLDASRQVPTADENRPKTVCQTPIMKVYGVATDAGEANIAQLVAATAGKLDTAVYENNSQYYREDFTSSGTFIPKKLGIHRLRICGGGGGGGGVKFGDASGGCGGGGGGASGQEGDFYIDITSFDPIPVLIGAGGAGGVNTTGSTGGNTSFGSYVTVAGGYGGAGNASLGYTFYNGGTARGTACSPGGAASICQLSFTSGKITYVNPGQGGQSSFGIAGPAIRTAVTVNGYSASGYGAGGGGAASFNGESATGGNGAPGYLSIEYIGLHG